MTSSLSNAPWTLQNGLYLPGPLPKTQYGNKPLAFDLFAGAGGMSTGLIQAGYRVVGALDSDPDATRTYLTNVGTYPVQIHFVEPHDRDRLERKLQPKASADTVVRMSVSGSGWIKGQPDIEGVPHFWLGDVRKVTGSQILSALGLKPGDLDLVCGGPPCQGFSSSNSKRDVMDPRNSLIFEFCRLVLELQPKTMVMENVPGILHMRTEEGIPVVDAICKVLSEGGFGGYEALKRTLLATPGLGAVLKPSQAPARPAGAPARARSFYSLRAGAGAP